MMKNCLVFVILLCFIINKFNIKAEQNPMRMLHTNLDYLRILPLAVRRLNWKISDTPNNLYIDNLNNMKAQKIISNSTKFFCDTKNGPGRRSLIPPISINKLHPGDIDIIAVMGDSLSSGNGAFSNFPTHLVNEYRSVSWSGGGLGNWRQFITLPNLLKEFNPNLYGYSIGNGFTIDKISKLNLAEPVALSVDMPYQARVLINRMKADPKVNMEKHWKILTILIGNLDFCSDSCYYSSYEKWADFHEKDLIKTLRILRNNVPRLLVNIVSFPNLLELLKLNEGIVCYVTHYFACPCVFNSAANRKKSFNAIQMWYQKDLKVAAMDEFNTESFAVMVQPFATNFSSINEASGTVDWTVMSSDCFHLSQKGHAIAAISLWNNMLQPIGLKATTMTDKIICPTVEHHYIATKTNYALQLEN